MYLTYSTIQNNAYIKITITKTIERTNGWTIEWKSLEQLLASYEQFDRWISYKICIYICADIIKYFALPNDFQFSIRERKRQAVDFACFLAMLLFIQIVCKNVNNLAQATMQTLQSFNMHWFTPHH